MAASNIPLPQQLTTVGNIATNWKRFKAQWNNYETATDLCKDPSKAKRTAIFLTCLSNDAYDVFESLQLDEEDSRDIEKVIQAFDTYCIGEINVTYERYVLNKRIQEENENFDAYLTAIRGLIKTCEYGNLEESILRDRIVIGIRDDGTRKKLLQMRKLTLGSAVDLCRASEVACKQLREFRDSDDVRKLTNTASSVSRQRRPHQREQAEHQVNERRRQQTPNRGSGKCKFCGRNHRFQKDMCPAYGKKCDRCGKMNHFANMCQSKTTDAACNWLNSEDEEVLSL